jgi:ATP-dependent Clp endopeptidase proteolytic subunit ClpP
MGRAKFTRPDGRDGTYGQWTAEIAAKWSALSASEQAASRAAAAARLAGQIRAQADDGPTLVHIYDEIGYFGVWPADVVSALSGISGDIEVHLNSPGGNVFDGMAIYAALKDRPGNVGMVVDGLAASAASFIAMAASPGQLAMTPNGTMMVHEAWGVCMGNAADMEDTAARLEQASTNIASVYAERGGRTAAECRDLMRAETWLVGQEAVDAGLADTIRKPRKGAAPAAALAAALPWNVTIMAGHAVSNAAADESAWDASRAWSAGAASDDPAAFYNAICAGKKTGDPATQAAHALPHHYHPGDPPNRHGVSAALGRLPGTDGLTNRAAAEAHLKSHQSAMGDAGSSNHAHEADLSWFDPAFIREAFEEAST